jgi:uncharacterized protein (DUF1800 family)
MIELRAQMTAFAAMNEDLPSPERVAGWAKSVGKSAEDVRALYCEVIGDPDAWDLPIGGMDDGRG